MKKIILTFALAMIAATGAFAQEFLFGVKAGITGNWIPKTNVNLDDKVLPNTGFYGAVAGTWEFNDRAFLQAELMYARKGISTKGELDGSKYWRKNHYLELPLLFGAKMADDRLRIAVGPQFAYCLGSKVFDERYIPSPAVSDEVKKFNFALVLQPSYMILDALGVDVKLDYALTNTFNDSNDIGRNISVQLGLSYWFGR